MKLGRRKLITKNDAKMFLHAKGLKVKPSYHHEDYLFTSFTMPYPLKDKLDRVAKRFGMSRSGFVQMLIDKYEE